MQLRWAHIFNGKLLMVNVFALDAFL